MSLTFNGKPFQAGDFQAAILKAALDRVKAHLHETISSIRNPRTGEFPVVNVTGNTLESVSVRVEASSELLAIVRERIAPDDLRKVTLIESRNGESPRRAFLSYGWEDRDLANRIAETLQANGIDTWWAEWEIKAGDSLRQRIDDGLRNCTDFLVLLTPASIEKPWVNQEMDAGFVRTIEDQARFIPIRKGLLPSALPPLLRGMLSPALDDFEADVRTLINDILGVTRKPPLGSVPAVAQPTNSTYSPAATVIAKLFVETTNHAQELDPMLSLAAICESTSLTEEEVSDGLYELGSMIAQDYRSVMATPELYIEFDKQFKGWDPCADALTIAADLTNDASFPREPQQIAARYGWEARRLNPALSYLIGRKLVGHIKHLGMGQFVAVHFEKIDATRRFVKSRQ